MRWSWTRLAVAALWLVTQGVSAQTSDRVSDDAELDRVLAKEARLSIIEGAALARHPALQESSARAAAAAERASGEERLPDPEFKYEQWGVPLNRPYALNRANTIMFGLRQAIPAPGSRDARGRAATEEASMVKDQRRALERDLTLRVRKAYFQYYAADQVLRVHLEHVALAEQMVAQTRANYEVGRGNQQDVLKVLVELSRLHNDLADIRQQQESSRLMLNSLMARPPDAPLGPPMELPRQLEVPDAKALEKTSESERPELSAARRAVRRADATLDAATVGARRPSFMVGADYWLMPTQNNPHAYGAMVTMSLPWLSPRRRAEVREAEHTVAAERHAAESVKIATAFEVHDAVARLEAANSSLEVIERDLLPQAEKSLEAARASFSVGQTDLLSLLDALRSYFQIRIEHSRARSRVMENVASVEFASGARLIGSPSGEISP